MRRSKLLAFGAIVSGLCAGCVAPNPGPADPDSFAIELTSCEAETAEGTTAYEIEITNLEDRYRRFNVLVSITDANGETKDFDLHPIDLLAPGESVVESSWLGVPVAAPATCSVEVSDSRIDAVSGTDPLSNELDE